MKVCLQVTIALDICIKEKNDTLYLPWISTLSFFYAKAVYLVRLSGEVPYSLFSNPSDIPTLPPHPSPPPPPTAYYILHKFPSPSPLPLSLLIRTPSFIWDLRVFFDIFYSC